MKSHKYKNSSSTTADAKSSSKPAAGSHHSITRRLKPSAAQKAAETNHTSSSRVATMSPMFSSARKLIAGLTVDIAAPAIDYKGMRQTPVTSKSALGTVAEVAATTVTATPADRPMMLAQPIYAVPMHIDVLTPREDDGDVIMIERPVKFRRITP